MSDIDTKQINQEKTKTIFLLGQELDLISTIIFSIGILIMFFFKKYILTDYEKTDKIFTGIVSLFFIFSIYNSGIYNSTFLIEEEELKTIEQISIILLSSIVIFTTFINKSFMTNETYKLMFISLMLCLLSLIYIPGEKTANVKRIVRKIKSTLLILTLSLFIYSVFIIVFYNRKFI